MGKYKLTVLPKQEDWDPVESLPKYGIEYDSRFFDLDSLVRMYGKDEVEKFFGGKLRRRTA